MSLSIGIVGLPNVGKSSLFTALTKKSGFAANYPFATIEPNVGLIPVPDKRLDGLAAIDHPAKIIPATVEFVDIAGLVAGASRGEGLGNKFLANIRETDAICEVVRFFSDPNVEHVSKKVDPQSDVETIKTELILADIATIEKALPRLEKEGKRYKEKAINFEAAQKVLEGLNEGKRALQLNLSEEEQDAIRELCLLTICWCSTVRRAPWVPKLRWRLSALCSVAPCLPCCPLSVPQWRFSRCWDSTTEQGLSRVCAKRCASAS